MSDLLILALIVLLILSLLVTIAGFLLYSGLLSEVDIRTGSPPIKNITIAYKFREGPYKDCGSTFTESCSIGPKLYCIGVYYDDPNTVRLLARALCRITPLLLCWTAERLSSLRAC